MKRVIQIALMFLAFMAIFVGVVAWGAPKDSEHGGPVFTVKDRAAIDTYYKTIVGTLAPGSVDRSTFPLEVEKELTPDGVLPSSMEKDLEWLPRDIREQLSSLPTGYQRFKLGHDVLILKLSDLHISDVMKGVAWNK